MAVLVGGHPQRVTADLSEVHFWHSKTNWQPWFIGFADSGYSSTTSLSSLWSHADRRSLRSILLQYKSTSLAFFSLDNADSAYGSNANLSSVGSCAAPGLRLKSRESTTRYLKNSRPQYKQEEKKNLLNIIPEEEVSFYNTSIEVPVPDDCRYHEPKKKKGFHEEEHRKTDNMHPATLFEVFFPKQEKAEKMKPEPEHYSCQKSNDIDMRKKMRQDREIVDHSEEKN